MKKLPVILVSLLLFVGQAESSSTNIEELNKIINEFYAYSTDERSTSERLGLLKKYEKEIQNSISESPNNPQLWWLLGRTIFIQRFVYEDLYRTDQNLWKKINERTVEAYNKAMELDGLYEPHLELGMIESIMNLGDSELAVKAGEKLIKKINEDASLAEYLNEVEMVSQINLHLIKLEQYERVEELQSYLEGKYNRGSAKKLLQKRRAFQNKKIEEAKVAKMEAIAASENKSIEVVDKFDSTKQQAPQVPAQITNQTTQKVEPPAPENIDNRLWYVALVILILLVVGVALIRRRRQ